MAKPIFRKNKKNSNLSSTEFAHRVVKIEINLGHLNQVPLNEPGTFDETINPKTVCVD